MARHNYGHSPRPWSKLKGRVEALFAADLTTRNPLQCVHEGK
jgi:hypothetical protein